MEQWSQSMSIRVIDHTFQWMEEGILSIEDFVSTCKALSLGSSATDKRRVLTKKTCGLPKETNYKAHAMPGLAGEEGGKTLCR